MKRDYTYQDHFKFGWGDGLYNFDDRTGPYWVKWGKVSRPVMSYREECINAAKLIAESAEKPIMVCYSGGIDSEAILYSMMDANVPCEAVIMNVHLSGQQSANRHDIEYALSFVKKHNIKHHLFDFDVDNYMKTKLIDDARRYQTVSAIWPIHCQMLQKYKDYLCIKGDGTLKLQRNRSEQNPNGKGMYIVEHPRSIASIHSSVEVGSTSVPRFYMYTPELMLSYLTCEDIKTYVNYEQAFENITSVEIKPFIFAKQWPEMAARPKFHGYEHVPVFYRDKWVTTDRQDLVPIMKEVYDAEYPNDLWNHINYEDLVKGLTSDT